MPSSFRTIILATSLLSAQQIRCAPQLAPRGLFDPHCSDDVGSWGTIDLSNSCVIAISDGVKNDDQIPKRGNNIPEFLTFLASKERPPPNPGQFTHYLQTPRRYTHGALVISKACNVAPILNVR